MKTKLLCLAMSLILFLSVLLTGCGKKTNDDATDDILDKASESTRYLTMWVVSEKPVSADTASAVTAAVNDITMTKFSTKLAIYFLTEEEYRQKLTETIRANEDAKNPLLSNEPTTDGAEGETTVEAVETVTNKYGLPEKKYPALQPNQVDIVYIQGYDMYEEYIQNEWLFAMDSELNAASKKIKEYVSGVLLNAVKYENATYAIPNNATIGEYTYMLLDKDLMEECSMDAIYNQGKIDGFFNQYVYSYLETVRDHYSGKCDCHKDVAAVHPIDASYDEISKLLAHCWSINPETYEAEESAFSVLGYRYTNPKTLSKGQTVLSFDSLFADKVFCENFLKINEFRLDGGYYGDVAEGQRAAVQFVTGSLTDYEKLAEDYYPVIVKYPAADLTDVYENMFGVCNYSVDTTRSMQILTYLNTNADLRNILQYGVEDVHYEFEGEGSDKKVSPLNEDYVMDIFKTGNVFITNLTTSMDEDIWEVGKKQNREALIEPLLTMDFLQLAKDSVVSYEETPSLSSKGYVYSVSTGYAKETLVENARLAKWIADSDAAGSGIYVRHTSKTVAQNVTGVIYYYNNNISATKVNVTDGNGAITVNYEGTAGDGYELTVIEFYGKKTSSSLSWTASVNGAEAATSVTYQNSIVDFDFFDTDAYDVVFNESLTKSQIQPNVEAWKAIDSVVRKHPQSTDPFVWTYKHTYGEGDAAKTVYSYLFYINKTETLSTVTCHPTVKDGVLTLDLQYTTGRDLKEDEAHYKIFTVTATTDVGISDVVFDLKMNGEAPTNITASEFESNPGMVFCGNLDIELVKFFAQFNADVETMINACTSVEELETLIDDLHTLLKVQQSPFDLGTISVIPNKMKSEAMIVYVKELNISDFYWNLLSATSNQPIVHQVLNETTEKVEQVTINNATQEAYHYYSSPYMIYFAWLKACGFAK